MLDEYDVTNFEYEFGRVVFANSENELCWAHSRARAVVFTNFYANKTGWPTVGFCLNKTAILSFWTVCIELVYDLTYRKHFRCFFAYSNETQIMKEYTSLQVLSISKIKKMIVLGLVGGIDEYKKIAELKHSIEKVSSLRVGFNW